MASISTERETPRAALAWWQMRFDVRRQWAGFAYAVPGLIFVVGLFVVPLILVGRMSLSRWGLLTGDAGLNFPKNFIAISTNRLFWPAVFFTFEYTVLVTVLLLGFGLGLAMLVQSQSRWTGVLRTAFLLPVSLGLAAASLLAYGFFSPEIGPIGPTLEAMGMAHGAIQFLGTPLNALLSTTILVVWKYAGFYMLILLVGLQGIPDDLYEAAALDGATGRQTFRYVTLPLLRPSLALATVLCVTGSLLAFDQFFILTKGAPNNSTVTVVQVIYREAFQRQNLGTAAALSVIILVVLVVLNALQLKFMRGPDHV
jgi:multiple sugar transport system permease protein